MNTNKLANNFITEAIKGFKFRFFIIFLITLIFEKSTELIIMPYILKIVGDSYTDKILTTTKVLILAFSYVLCFCLKDLLKAIFAKQIFNDSFYKFRISTSKKLFHYLSKHSIDYFENIQSGVITNKFKNIVSSLSEIFENFFTILTSIVLFIFLLFFYGQISPVLTIFLFIWSIVFLLYCYFNSKMIFRAESNVYSKNGLIYGAITDDFLNISNIKSNSTQNIEKCNVKKYGIDSLKAITSSMKMKTISNIVYFFLIAILMCFMLGYSLKLLVIKKITVGTFIFVGQNIVLLSFLLRGFFKSINRFIELYSSLIDGINTLIQPYDIVDKIDAKNINIFDGKIEFKNVDFKY